MVIPRPDILGIIILRIMSAAGLEKTVINSLCLEMRGVKGFTQEGISKHQLFLSEKGPDWYLLSQDTKESHL